MTARCTDLDCELVCVRKRLARSPWVLQIKGRRDAYVDTCHDCLPVEKAMAGDTELRMRKERPCTAY